MIQSGLLAKSVTYLQMLDIVDTESAQQQAAAILTAVGGGSNLIKLDISEKNLTSVNTNWKK